MTTSIYGCHNSAPRDPTATYPVQAGWHYHYDPALRATVRVPIVIQQVSVFNNGCQYTIRSPDPHCAGCRQAAR